MIINATSFEEFDKQIAAVPQQDGEVGPTHNGVAYKELHTHQLYQDGDEKFAEKIVCIQMCQKINTMFEDVEGGIILWRIRPEHDIHVFGNGLVIAYRDDGAVKDPLTDLNCVTVPGWKTLGFYMRLVVLDG